MDRTEIYCIDTQLKDLKRIVFCHRRAFPDALSTKLGVKFSMRMLSWYIEAERGVMFHLESGGNVLGYAGGIMTRIPGLPGASTSITQHAFETFVLSFALRPWLIFHPENLKRYSFIMRNIRLKLGLDREKKKVVGNSPKVNFVPFMGLVVIGVDPAHQGKGYGSVLLREFESRARKEGFARITLSVKSSNRQAIAAYEKNGWLVDQAGKEELTMCKNI